MPEPGAPAGGVAGTSMTGSIHSKSPALARQAATTHLRQRTATHDRARTPAQSTRIEKPGGQRADAPDDVQRRR